MIALVDYGQADVALLARAFRDVTERVEVAPSADRLARASKVVVGGAGAFGAMARGLRDRSLVRSIVRAILDGRPYLGIGLGMQLLLDVSYQDGQHTGLGVIPGKSIPFETDTQHPVRRQFRPPHVGWAPVRWASPCPLLAGLTSGESFFFEHASHAQTLDRSLCAAQANFGIDFAAVIWDGRMYGTQFLPERSQDAGRRLLANFAAM